MTREFRGNADALTSEQKILVINGWDLLDRTREESAKVRGMDMTWRMQLRSDMKALEKTLKAMEKDASGSSQKKLEDELCSGTLSVEELTEKSKRLPSLKDELDEKSMRWLELSELC